MDEPDCKGKEQQPPNDLGRKPTVLDDMLVRMDVCPRCLGELDSGWECNDCDYDAYELAYCVFGRDIQ